MYYKTPTRILNVRGAVQRAVQWALHAALGALLREIEREQSPIRCRRGGMGEGQIGNQRGGEGINIVARR